MRLGVPPLVSRAEAQVNHPVSGAEATAGEAQAAAETRMGLRLTSVESILKKIIELQS